MNALVLAPLDAHAPTPMTPMERARRLLDRLPVHPMTLPTDDPLRVLHDVLAGDELEGLLSESRISELQCELRDAEEHGSDQSDRADRAEEVIDDIKRVLGSRADGKKNREIAGLVTDLIDEVRPLTQRLRNIRMALGEFGDAVVEGDLADTVRRVAEVARRHVAGGEA